MNTRLMKAKIAENGDTQQRLAQALGTSLSSLNPKINGKADFWQTEIAFVKKRYNLTAEEVDSIFFDVKVSNLDINKTIQKTASVS